MELPTLDLPGERLPSRTAFTCLVAGLLGFASGVLQRTSRESIRAMVFRPRRTSGGRNTLLHDTDVMAEKSLVMDNKFTDLGRHVLRLQTSTSNERLVCLKTAVSLLPILIAANAIGAGAIPPAGAAGLPLAGAALALLRTASLHAVAAPIPTPVRPI